MSSTASTAPTKKQRLEHVDAMRPLKQFGVVSNHVLLFFAPALSITAGSLELLLHVTREAFLFISACMLTYAYSDLKRGGYKRFYKRRAITVLVPFICWTIIYFAITMPSGGYSLSHGLVHLLYLLGTGYYQLYYLVVIMEFYLVFPLVMKLIKKTSRHWLVLGISLLIQLVYVSLMHWNILPSFLQNFWANREILSYQFYLIAGVIAALHFHQFHDWVVSHVRSIILWTAAATAVSEAWYLISLRPAFSWMAMNSAIDPFMPIMVPFNIGAILCIYLIGVYLVSDKRPKIIRAAAMSGSENSYGVYVSQMLFISALFNFGWLSLSKNIPWDINIILEILIVFFGSVALTALLARTPLSAILTGRKKQKWSTLIPDYKKYLPNPNRSEFKEAEELS